MITPERYDAVVSSLYGTVLDAGAWPQALAALRNGFNCAAVDLNTRVSTSVRSLSTEPAISEAWMQSWASVLVNPINAANMTIGAVALAPHLVDHVSLLSSAYYNEFLLAADIPQVMIIKGPSSPNTVSIINVLRGRRQPDFAEAELALARQLSSHIVNALTMAAMLGWKAWAELTASLETAREAMILVDAAGAVLHMNRVARTLTEARDGILASRRGLEATFAGDTKRLREAIWRAAAAPAPRIGGMLAIERPSNPRSLIASITPLAEHVVDLGAPRPRALIVILDPTSRAATPSEDLHRLFGLTRREADIAQALAEGLTITEAAQRCGVTIVTARNYLARVLRKTQVSRQSELILLLSGLSRLGDGSPLR